MAYKYNQKDLISIGEPALGTVYNQEEIDVVNNVLKKSMDPSVGFYAAEETLKFEHEFSKLCNSKYAIALNGAGGAIDIVIRSLNIKDGDEIISCSINFPGTHLSIIGNGAKLVLAEPDPLTLNLDPTDLKGRLTKRTKAVVITYMNGLAADMDSINSVINSSKLFGKDKPKVIVDAARALGTTFKRHHIGPEAWATVFSFQSKKTLSTLGEGGMVITNDSDLELALRQFRSFGKNENWGSNYKMTKIQAAVGSVQLNKLPKLVDKRRRLAEQRNQFFSKIPEISIQQDTEYSKNSYYLYTLILPPNPKGTKRDKLMQHLKNGYGVGTVVGNPPTYKSNSLIKKRVIAQQLPIAEDLGERIICVSIHPLLTKKTNLYVIDSFLKAYEKAF